MACDCCKRKGIPIKCAYCPGEFCVRHMPLDAHDCPGVSAKKDLQKKDLEKRMAFEAPPKLAKI